MLEQKKKRFVMHQFKYILIVVYANTVYDIGYIVIWTDGWDN